MGWNLIAVKWRRFRDRAKEKWGKLTDDELDTIDGRYELLIRKLRERYYYTREQAEREVEDWKKNLGGKTDLLKTQLEE